LNDCIKRGIKESQLLREIVDLHYRILNHYHLEEKEFSEIRKNFF
jgi:hypothetical protein